ncbi:hypothetical protein MNB_ARC-1_1344 [hydrothermal vent metagenome]|uniref:SPOR domain-containing protein n=1 Tax=hydrothermal vent metagenome TaxID=652676 RepID=A0A3B1DU44_9ZZZZ
MEPKNSHTNRELNNLYDEQNETIAKTKEFFEMDDIRLDSNNSIDKETKRKYIILGIAVIILFLLTIIIMPLISQTQKENIVFENSKFKSLQTNISNIDKEQKLIMPKEIEQEALKPTIPEIPNVEQETSEPVLTKESIKKRYNNLNYYIQIGAFINNPNKELSNKLRRNKFNYTIHKAIINKKIYNKVLIGPYSNVNSKKMLNKVKKYFNNDKAYILKLQ